MNAADVSTSDVTRSASLYSITGKFLLTHCTMAVSLFQKKHHGSVRFQSVRYISGLGRGENKKDSLIITR
jgi:hypothetical protein